MKIGKTDIVVVAAGALSLAGLALLMPRLPETIPVHWNIRSEADSWGPRWTILLFGALPLAVFLLMKAAPRIDPKRTAPDRNRKTYEFLTVAVSLALLCIPWIVALASLGWKVDVGILVRVVVGVLFLVLGNVMGRLKPNWFAGIRTPWTLADPEVWRQTHRRGGFVMVGMGLAMLASLIAPHSTAAAVAAFAAVIGGAAYMLLYSYLAYRKRKNAEAAE